MGYNKVIDNLYIGDMYTAISLDSLSQLPIRHIINVTKDVTRASSPPPIPICVYLLMTCPMSISITISTLLLIIFIVGSPRAFSFTVRLVYLGQPP